ncbi:MAG: ROK family protein, partial [Thermoplasmata archaeon]
VHDGRRCHCPNRGCLEAYVSGWAIAERAREAARRDPGRAGELQRRAGAITGIDSATVGDAARAGDPLAREILADTIAHLASGIVGIVNACNPRLVILGGGVIEGIPGVLGPLRTQVRRRALRAATARLRIVRAELGTNAGIIGAAALARPPAGRDR